MPTLPDVKAKFVVDYSDLTKAEKASAKAHGEFQAGAVKSTTHTLRFEQSLTTLMDHFGGMPPIVNQAGRSIESMASQGVSGMALIGGAALVAVGAIAEVAGHSMEMYRQLGERVENYKRVTGASAEESSRMVQTFEALGVSEETATQGMFKLSKAIEGHQAKLAGLGIEVAKTSTGQIDLSKTLLNVADAYNAQLDPAKKNLILFDAFGKSGKDMIPILEQGSAALQKLEQSARLVFTEEDLQRLKELKIKQTEIKQGWDAIWESIGQQLIPAQEALSDSVLRGEYVQKRLNEAVRDGKISQDELMFAHDGTNNAAARLSTQFGAEYDAAQKVKTAVDSQAQSMRDAAAAADQEWAALDKLVNQEEAQVNAGFALELANLAVKESQAKVNQAQEAANAAFWKYGRNSDEYKLASDNYTRALIEQEKAYYAAAAAARKLQEDTDLATTGQKDAKKEAEAYIDALQAEANTLDANSPLRKDLQAYIDKLKNEIPASVTTRFIQVYEPPKAHRAMAGGGHAYAGEQLWIGEHGPEAWTPDRPGTVTPTGQTPLAAPQMPPATSGGDTFNFHQVQTDPWQTANEIAWAKKTRRL